MKKSVLENNVFYTIAWSKDFSYEKHSASRILPELAGILCLMEKARRGEPGYLLFYSCWSEGLRMGLKNLMDPVISPSKWLQQQLEGRSMLFKYTIVESSPLDMQDVMYWLIHEYSPLLNSLEEFSDSKRYRDIYVKELLIGDDRVTERFPKYGL